MLMCHLFVVANLLVFMGLSLVKLGLPAALRKFIFGNWPYVGSRIIRIDPLHFLAGCSKRQLNQSLSYLSFSIIFFSVSLFTRATFCVFIS